MEVLFSEKGYFDLYFHWKRLIPLTIFYLLDLVRRNRGRRIKKALRPAQRIIPELNIRDLALDGVFLSGARAIPNYMSALGLSRYQTSADLMLASVAKKGILNRGGTAMFKTGIAIGLSNILEDAMRGRLPLISGLFGPRNGVAPSNGAAAQVANMSAITQQ